MSDPAQAADANASGEVVAYADRGCAPLIGFALQVGLAFILLAICSTIYFGSPKIVFAIVFLTTWHGIIPLLASALIAGYVALRVPSPISAVISATVFGLGIVPLTGLVLDTIQKRQIAQLEADDFVAQPFRETARRVLGEDMFYVHAAVLKDCKAYSWSYSKMAFFELSPFLAPNVIPARWGTACRNLRDIPRDAPRAKPATK